ncbi:MAG: hypothetical protein PSV22_14355 [Pseudolabrys sp.]|nr:hypothetical protein [Pseudolabrys sp.]
MHYRNGRPAKNGDTVVQIGTNAKNEPTIVSLGVLHDAIPGNDYCNGSIAPLLVTKTMACMCDCLHIDDVTALLKEKSLDRRPAGK